MIAWGQQLQGLCGVRHLLRSIKQRPPHGHIGINTNGSLTSLVTDTVVNITNNAQTTFSASAQWYAWIDFDGPSMNLQVRISTTSTKPAAAQIQSTVNIYSLMGQSTMYLGFGGGTGGYYQTNSVYAWEFILAGLESISFPFFFS